MKDKKKIIIVFIIIVAAVIVYIGCACLPSSEEIKEYFNKLKHKKEQLTCSVDMFEKLHNLYPSLFTNYDETQKIFKKITKNKTFNNDAECVEFISAYIANHPKDIEPRLLPVKPRRNS